MIPRLLPDSQLELFPGMVLYMSQADAATTLGITTRMIQYWESQGLLHPEQPQEGRARRYTQRDLVEMKFIKEMVVDQGYSVPSLKEKLERLPAPYYYDARDVFWDLREGRWKSRSDLASEQVGAQQGRLVPALAQWVQRLAPAVEDPEKLSVGLLGIVRDGLAGRLPDAKPPKRRRRKPTPE